MKKLLFLLTLLFLKKALHAQYVYTIKADSVKITNSCDTAELIIENHTQNVPGFLFNKGRGRTEFRKPLLKISDTLYMVGIDSLKLPNAWLQGGNAWGATGILGTKDNNHIDFYTNNIQQGRWTNTGNLLLGTIADTGYKINVNGKLRAGINSIIGSPDIASIGGYTQSLTLFGNFQVITAAMLGSNGGFGVYRQEWARPGATTMSLNNVPMTAYDGKIYFGGPNAQYFGVNTFGYNSITGGPFTRTKYTIGNDSDPAGWNDSHALFGISDASEFTTISGYPSRANYYLLETRLSSPVTSANTGQIAVRAPLKIGARQLWFYTGDNAPGAEVMRMTEVGNVLIGSTTDYGYKLQVVGHFSLNNGIGTTITTNSNNMLDMVASNARLQVGGENIIASINKVGYFDVNKNSNSYLRVLSNGYIGINTASPTAQLHTTGTVRFAGLTSNESLTRVVVCDANSNLYYRNNASWSANGIINSDLAVNGALSAQKMKITQTGPWPDYVFSNQYHLPSLNEVEQFVKLNNHLPGIPSAIEVEKKGIDVGENQAALLKKIEELTLYIIEQDKKLQKQGEEITELKNQNKQWEGLKMQMDELQVLIKNKMKLK